MRSDTCCSRTARPTRATSPEPAAFSLAPAVVVRSPLAALALCAAVAFAQPGAVNDRASAAAEIPTTKAAPIDRAKAARLQSLDPERITDQDVRDVLAG